MAQPGQGGQGGQAGQAGQFRISDFNIVLPPQAFIPGERAKILLETYTQQPSLPDLLAGHLYPQRLEPEVTFNGNILPYNLGLRDSQRTLIFTWNPHHPGEYQLSFKLDDNHVIGSPLTVNIANSSAARILRRVHWIDNRSLGNLPVGLTYVQVKPTFSLS